MRKRLQRAAAIGMAAILCIQNAQFGLTTFADELSDFARMEGILNAQEMRVTPSDAEKNLPGGTPDEDRNADKNGEIKENPDGNSAGQENVQGDTEKASDSDAKKEENSGIGDNTKKDGAKKDPVNGSEKSKILSWNWVDEEEYFVDGKILLSIGEEDQVSFDELITMLPTEISAEVLGAEETAITETIQIKNWTGSAYVQDSEGRWPTEGEFTFTAVLPEEYELAEETAPVEAVVSLDGDAVEMAAVKQNYILYANIGNSELYYYLNNGQLEKQGDISGITVTKDPSGTYQMTLSNTSLQTLVFRKEKFEVTLDGTVNLIIDNKELKQAIPLLIIEGSDVEIKGSGNMNIKNHSWKGISVMSDSSLKVNCDISIQTLSGVQVDTSAGGAINNDGKFWIKKGTIQVTTPDAPYPRGLVNRGMFTIENDASLILKTSAKYHAVMVNYMNGNIVNHGTLQVDGVAELNSPSIFENNGRWIQNGTVKIGESNTYNVIKVGTGGTIEGTGEIRDGIKPDSGFKARSGKETTTYSSQIELSQFLLNPRNQTVKYELTGNNNPPGSSITGSYLMPAKNGTESTYTIKATSTKTNFWPMKEVTITLTVGPEAMEGVTITPYSGTYDGKLHEMVKIEGVSKAAVIKYKVGTYTGRNTSTGPVVSYTEWSTTCPTVTDVYDAPAIDESNKSTYLGKRLYIRISDNGKGYQTQSEDNINGNDTSYLNATITPKNLSDSDIEATVTNLEYDPSTKYHGGEFGKFITLKHENQLIDNKFWKVSDYRGLDKQSLINNSYYNQAGRYEVTLNAWSSYLTDSIGIKELPTNFTGSRKVIVTVNKGKIHPIVSSGVTTIKKTYDGSTDVPENILANNLTYEAKNDKEASLGSILKFDRDEGGKAVYSSKDVGANNDIQMSGFTIDSAYAKNYELKTDQLNLPGEITKATLDSNSKVKAKASLIYTGTAQQPKVVYDIRGIAGDSGKNIPAERSTNAENDGTANSIDGFKILYKVSGAAENTYSETVPSFKEIGTHTVEYKVTSTNYEDLTGTFAVQIQKMDLANAYVGFTSTSQIYNGSAIDPGVTVKGKETSTDVISALEYTVEYQRTKDAAGNAVTEDKVSAPENAGTYDVIITAKPNSTSVTGSKKVTDGVMIQPKPFTDGEGNVAVSISMTQESFTYNAASHQVEDTDITVTDMTRNLPLKQGTDYTFSRPANDILAAGKYIFTFNGTGNYTGSCTKEIEVQKADLTTAEVEISGTYTYSGTAQEPGKEDTTQVQVTLNNILVNSSEYTLEYADNTAAAEANSNAAPTVTVKANADGNYQGSVSKTFTISRKALTVTAENKKVTYKETAPKFTAVYDGFVDGETLENVSGAIKFLCEYENGSPVGDYEIWPEITGLANYEVTANKGTLSVLPRTPEFVDSENLYTTRVYDGKAVDLAPTTDGDGKMSCEITNRETKEVLTSDPVDVGKYHVVYSFAAGTNYSAGSVAYDFDITPAPLKITAADQKLSYLDGIPEYTADYDGFVNGENLKSAGGTVHFNCSYQKGTAVGSYPINPEVTGLKNYEVTTESGTMTVEKRTPVFTDSANLYITRVYDGKAIDLTPATDGDGTVSRVITNRETNEVLTSDPVDVGEYRVVYRVSEGKNYTEGSVSYDFAITQAPLVITAEDKNVVFGAKAPEYTVVYDGFVNGETEAVLTGTLVVTCDYTVESREYTYEIVPFGLSAKNYAIIWKNGVLTARYPESDSDDYEETSKPANSKMPESGTNNPGQGSTAKDAKKGYVNENSGIVSGKTLTEEMLKNDNGSLNDGYSHWIQTNAGWWFRYADGSYPKAAGAVNSGSGNSSAAQSYEWIQIDGNWWSFDSNGYLGTGWIVDPVYGNWFYVDANTGMKTGWVQIDGKWYYFNPVSDGTKGIMFANRMTPDGWFVREDGSWDEKR